MKSASRYSGDSNASRFTLADFSVKNLNENFSQPCRIDFSEEMIHFGKRGGSRLLIHLNMLNGYIVELPFGNQLESAPPPDSLDSEFGYTTCFLFDHVLPVQ